MKASSDSGQKKGRGYGEARPFPVDSLPSNS